MSIEPLLLCPGTVIGKVEALFDHSVDSTGGDRRARTRVQQHVLTIVWTLAMLNDLFEIPERIGQFANLDARRLVNRDAAEGFLQFVDQLAENPEKLSTK